MGESNKGIPCTKPMFCTLTFGPDFKLGFGCNNERFVTGHSKIMEAEASENLPTDQVID